MMMKWIQLLRIRQWVKNGFVLAPILFAGELNDLTAWLHIGVATLLFCIAASAVYVLNDLVDLPKDRLHADKLKKRPLAAGTLAPWQAKIALFFLYGFLFLGSLWSPQILMPITLYIILNIAYSLYLKHQPVLDIFCIALGFVLRVYTGAQAISVPVSSWMFITTLCLALYLAAIKRRQELQQRGSESRQVLAEYTVKLADRYAQMSATGAFVFYSLFVVSVRPEMVMSIPLVLYGLFRYWWVVETRAEGESPTDVLLSDKPLMITVLLWLLVWIQFVE